MVDNAAVTHTTQYSGFARRLAAMVLDVLITILFYVALGVTMRLLIAAGILDGNAIFGAPQGDFDLREMWISMSPLRKILVVLFTVAPGFIYYVGFHASAWQATVGKKLLGLKVVDQHGARIGLGRSLVRYLALYFLSTFTFGLVTIVSAITIAATAKSQAVHDMLARTEVIRTN